ACATGGFSTKNASIGYFDNPIIEIILIVAMLFASIHFGLIYATFTRKANNMFRSEVVRTYGIVIAVCVLAITLSIYFAGLYPVFWQALREAVFQVVSIISTTGFATTDTNLWTPFAIVILIFASIVCACAGSTSGGVKINRLLLFVKVFFARLRLQRHPNAVVRIRVDGIVQEESQLDAVSVFIVSYLCFILIGTIFSTMFGLDMMTAFSSVVACIGNVGPGFGEVGSLDTYSQLPAVLKLQDTLLMLMGRLEIFGFIQLLFIKWWR
ncbi:MAG: TrkH family potassium uptake protein, partial [Alistipes sp.]